jgi:hypothetical protein
MLISCLNQPTDDCEACRAFQFLVLDHYDDIEIEIRGKPTRFTVEFPDLTVQVTIDLVRHPAPAPPATADPDDDDTDEIEFSTD